MKQLKTLILAILCALAGTANAADDFNKVTFTFTGEMTGQNTYTAKCSDGTNSQTVNITYGTDSEISFSVGNVITIKLKSSTNQLAYLNEKGLSAGGTATLTLG